MERSGKGLAISKAAAHFKLTDRYKWIHLADADGAFAPDYFKVIRRELNDANAAMTGYIKSMQGSTISQYRAFEYTFGMEVVRRFQNMIGTISIVPGPTSCFRADVFDKVSFNNGSLAEDFDVTLQIHRQQLGSIQFIENAVVYTQDPETLKDFVKQIRRWNKGILQGIVRHRIGSKATKLDAYLQYQIGLSLAMVLNYLVLLPITAAQRGVLSTLSIVFLLDLILMFGIITYAATRAKRWDILNAFPHIYALRWVSLAVFIWSFVEVIVLRRHQGNGTWKSVARRASA